MINLFKKTLPLKMIELSISLKELGVENLAWKKEDALLVIQHLMEQEKIILGGDVYKIENKKIAHTCDSWFYQVNLHYQTSVSTQAALPFQIILSFKQKYPFFKLSKPFIN